MYVACPRNKTGVIAVRNIYIQLRKIFHQSIFQLLQFSDQHKASWEGALWHRIQAYVLLVSQAAASSMENKNHRILDFMNPKVFLLILWWGFSNFFFFFKIRGQIFTVLFPCWAEPHALRLSDATYWLWQCLIRCTGVCNAWGKGRWEL